MARLIALRALEQELSGTGEVTVRIAFSIGSLQPEMVHVATDSGDDLSLWAEAEFPDLSPAAIADSLGLWDAGQSSWTYRDTSAYGHFGRSSFPWEQKRE